MAKQKPYSQLFAVGDRVEVAQAPRDGETNVQWLVGTVIKINSRLHVHHGGPGHMAYERAMYNRGEIRRVGTSISPTPEQRVTIAKLPKLEVHKKELMTEAEAARACASMFVRKGIPEGTGAGEFQVTDVDFDDDGEYFVTIRVSIGNLDVEMASTGHHMDQQELDAIHVETKNGQVMAI